MLRDLKTLRGFSLKAADGEIGNVRDVFFDDLHWTVRYLVADTGSWLTGKTVLIVPKFLGTPEDTSRTIPVTLTRSKVEGSPSIETSKPVTRQHEAEYLRYYGLSYYWPEPILGGFGIRLTCPGRALTINRLAGTDPNNPYASPAPPINPDDIFGSK